MDRRELQEAEKVVSALKRGAKLPPQCTDARACKAVCEDPKDIETARACFEFGKEAGLLPEGVSAEQAEKAFTALESGTGPFKSFAEMRQCDNPPTDEIFEKCIAFASEAGFIKPEDAEIIKKTGGKGPGGCRGREQCEAYCEANGEECFAFGQEHGLIREEDKARMQEGMGQMRSAIEQAPPEVAACIREAIPNLDAILAGQAFPSPALGEKMRECFESFFRSQGSKGFPGGEEFGGPPGGEGGFPGGDFGGPGKDRPCPAMPTVDSCPEDQELVGQEVPGCGFYGQCVPKGQGGTGGFPPPGAPGYHPPPEGFHPPEGTTGDHSGTDYQKQYPAEFQKQFSEQYQQEGQRQTQQQIEEQTRTEYQRQLQQAQQPPLGTPSPTGDYHPPTSGESHPPEGTYTPPSGTSQTAPTSLTPTPTSPTPTSQTSSGGMAVPAPSSGTTEQTTQTTTSGGTAPASQPTESTTVAPPPPPPTEYHPPTSGEYHPSFFRAGPNEELIGGVWESFRQLRSAR